MKLTRLERILHSKDRKNYSIGKIFDLQEAISKAFANRLITMIHRFYKRNHSVIDVCENLGSYLFYPKWIYTGYVKNVILKDLFTLVDRLKDMQKGSYFEYSFDRENDLIRFFFEDKEFSFAVRLKNGKPKTVSITCKCRNFTELQTFVVIKNGDVVNGRELIYSYYEFEHLQYLVDCFRENFDSIE